MRGKRSIEIREHRPDWNLFRDGCPHGESPAGVSDRADRLNARLGTLQGNVAVFSHGHFGRVLAVRWIGLPVGDALHFLLGTASVSILEEESPTNAAAIVLWNAGSNDIIDARPEQRTRDKEKTPNRKGITWQPATTPLRPTGTLTHDAEVP